LGDLPSGLAERFGSRRLPPELGERFGRQLLNALASTRCQATEDSAAKDATARAAGKGATVSFICRVPSQKGNRALFSDPAIQDGLSAGDPITFYMVYLLVRDRPEQTISGTARIDGNADIGYALTKDLMLESIVEVNVNEADDVIR